MKILLPLALFVAVLLVYALWGRDWLKTTSWGARFLLWIEPVEIALFKKSVTLLVARMLTGLGGVLTLLTQLGSIDITPLMPLVPDKYEGVVRVTWNLLPLLVTGLGMIVEKLRNATTLPIEVVAVPDKVIAENPVVAATVADAISTNVVAIAAIDEAKTEAKAA